MNQNEQVLQHLKAYGPLTAWGALNNYGIMRLAARINDLRNRGVRIKTIIHQRGKKKRFALYLLLGSKK